MHKLKRRRRVANSVLPKSIEIRRKRLINLPRIRIITRWEKLINPLISLKKKKKLMKKIPKEISREAKMGQAIRRRREKLMYVMSGSLELFKPSNLT